MSEVKGATVVDSEGAEWQLEGGAREELSGSTPKKVLAQFAAGFPKGWARSANAERRRLRQIQQLKEIDWRELPFVGIEFSAIESIYAQPFAFPHLARELQEGELANRGHPIYLFQGAQPCWSDKEQTMRNVPYIVAIDCAVPPPNKLVYHTLQLAKHDVIDMKSQPSFARYEWRPYIPDAVRQEGNYEKTPVQCFVLGWSGRGAQFSNMQEADVHRIEFLHPYVLLPQVVEKMEAPVVTCVDFEWTHEGKKYQIVFDKEIDRLATFLPEFVEDNQLTEAAEEPLKEALQNAFKQKRATEEAGFRAMQEEIAVMAPETQEALRGLRTFKFYPYHPELIIAPFVDDQINPYFGKATRVLLPSGEDVERLRADYAEQQAAAAAAATPSKRARSTPKRGREHSPGAPAELPAEAEGEKKAKLDEQH